MRSLVIIPFVTILSFVCSNYANYEQSFTYNSGSDLESCDAADENNDIEFDCECYDETANDFNYKICGEPNPGNSKIHKYYKKD